MRNRRTDWMLFWLGWALLGCSASPSPTLVPDAASEFQIQILSVSVASGDKVELMGTTTLPEGNCIYSQLVQEGAAVTWWPVGKCFPVSQPEWQIAIPLGVEGAPDRLDQAAEYCIKVWWPGAPSVTHAELDFDLAAPPSP